ncbi:uncharacterized protein JCM10292_003780 [Rhodotorula paludigena]|uniref:uncharacterized protein n=1 Tax=Rhodotorula paludigena TaxID=86838 RepID=UPI00317AA4BA
MLPFSLFSLAAALLTSTTISSFTTVHALAAPQEAQGYKGGGSEWGHDGGNKGGHGDDKGETDVGPWGICKSKGDKKALKCKNADKYECGLAEDGKYRCLEKKKEHGGGYEHEVAQPGKTCDPSGWKAPKTCTKNYQCAKGWNGKYTCEKADKGEDKEDAKGGEKCDPHGWSAPKKCVKGYSCKEQKKGGYKCEKEESEPGHDYEKEVAQPGQKCDPYGWTAPKKCTEKHECSKGQNGKYTCEKVVKHGDDEDKTVKPGEQCGGKGYWGPSKCGKGYECKPVDKKVCTKASPWGN